MIEAVKNICTVDLVFFAVLAVAVVIGTVRGASGEIARLLSLFCGVAAIWFAYRLLAAELGANQMLAFAGALLVTILVVILTHHLARKVIRLILGQPADAICGALMAFVGAFLILAVLWCGIMIFVPGRVYETHFENARSRKLVEPLVLKIHEKQVWK